MRKTQARSASPAEKYGWRSGLEEKIGSQLKKADVPFSFEAIKITYVPLKVERTYTPDFVLLSNGIVVETKGRFLTADRQKIKAVKAQHPNLDLRFVFTRSASRISKQSKTTYAAWCQALRIPFADTSIPAAWLTEPPNTQSLATLERLKEANALSPLRRKLPAPAKN